jgi:hypothetical protein
MFNRLHFRIIKATEAIQMGRRFDISGNALDLYLVDARVIRISARHRFCWPMLLVFFLSPPGWIPVQYFAEATPIFFQNISYSLSVNYPTIWRRSRNSYIGIATGCGLDSWGVGVRVPVGGKIFLLSMFTRPVLGPTQPPIQWVPGNLTPGLKRPGSEAHHSPPTNAEVRNKWISTSTPPVKHRDNFTFFLPFYGMQSSYWYKVKGKAIHLTGREGPWGCETSRLPHFLENRLTDGGKFVILQRRPPFTPRKIPGTDFC